MTQREIIRNAVLGSAVSAAVLAVSVSAQQNRSRRSAEEVEQLQHKQAELLAAWEKEEVEPLDSRDLAKIVSSITDKGTLPIPENGTKVGLDSLAVETRNDLNHALVGLLHAYCSELQTTAIIAYMKERNEQMDDAHLDKLKSIVQQNLKLSNDDVKALTAEDLFRLFRGDDVQSHWAAIQTNESCVRLWKTSEVLSKDVLDEFGKEYWPVFPGVAKYHHNFRPKTSLDDEVRNNGSALIADVKLLIRFDDKLFSRSAPYFVRFWFCTADKKWHPLQLVRTDAGDDLANDVHTVF